jgi:ribosomal protein S27E
VHAGYKRDDYNDAINRVRSEHSRAVKAAHFTVECPRCRTRQVVTDTPGMRICVKCGFEFRSSLR